MKKKVSHISLLILVVLLISPLSRASEKDQDHGSLPDSAVHEETESEFDPGEFIFDHIGDSYQWHIMTIGEQPISIPLPVIVYSQTKGLDVFFSSRFHHGHTSYKGYKIASTGENEGKLVEIMPDGAIQRPFLDISITKNVAAILSSVIIMILLFVSVGKRYKKYPYRAPKGLQNLVEIVVKFIRDEIAIPAIGEKHHSKFMPFLLSLFFFILLNNIMGLIPIPPGGANVTGNIAVTGALALLTFLMTNISGTRFYWKEIFNSPVVPVWLKVPLPLMPIIEIIGMFTKPFVLMVRLFANITAGHIVTLGFVVLIFVFGKMSAALGMGISVLSVTFVIFMTFLELLVAFIQAYIFTILSALYFGMAIEEEHE